MRRCSDEKALCGPARQAWSWLFPWPPSRSRRSGICDFTRVLSTAYKESKAYRDYDAARADYTKEITATTRDITDLENQKLDADKAGNQDLSLTLEKKIADRKAYLENYRRGEACHPPAAG